MILVSLHTKSSSICFMQSLFTNCSCQNGESLRHYHTNWPNNITTFFPFPVMFYLPWPCADHVLLFVDDVVTSWPQTKISDWSEIKCIVILAVQNRTCSIPKCVSCNFSWYRVIALFTLYFLVDDTSIMILALPCNRGFMCTFTFKIFWYSVYCMCFDYTLYHAFSPFLLSTAVQYLMIPREEVELDDVTSYNIFDNKIYKISP